MPPPIPNSYILPNPRFTAGEYPGAPYTKYLSVNNVVLGWDLAKGNDGGGQHV